MAGQQRDAKWLKGQLSRVLGWDDMIVEGLVDTVARAAGPGGDREELDEMVQNFMADSPAGIALINDFLAAAAGGGGGGRGSASGSGSAAATAATNRAGGGAGAAGGSGGAGGRSHTSTSAFGGGGGGGTAPQAPVTSGGGSGAGGSGGSGAGAGGRSYAVASTPTPQQQQQQQKAQGGGSGRVGGGGGGGDDDFGRFVRQDESRTAGGGGGSKARREDGEGLRSGSGAGGSNRDLQALEAGAAGAEKPASAAADGPAGGNGKVLGMFKAGGRLKTPAGKPVGVRGPDGGALALAASLERQVVNCLGCGKIYDCRVVTNDILRFLERGGTCTFCGDPVPLTYKDRQKAAEAAADAAAAAADASATAASASTSGAASGDTAEDAATVAARAFKDRLVEYDRNAAKRTTVIDDQSDYFEIDTNAWLTDQEREEFRRRRQLEEEAEKARKQRLTFTIDLIGRKVVLDEDVRKEAEAAAAAAADRAAAAAKAAKAAAAAADALRNTDGGGSAYGSGVAFKGNALEGGGGVAAMQEQLAAALDSLRRLKATANPSALAATSVTPLFLPSGGSGAKGAKEGSKAAAAAAATATGAAAASSSSSSSKAAAVGVVKNGAGTGTGTAAAAGASTGGASKRFGAAPTEQQQRGGRGSSSRAVGTGAAMRGGPSHSRVQHDLGSEFDLFGAEVALEELMMGAMAGRDQEEEDGPYDICLPESDTSSAPSTSYGNNSTASKQSAIVQPPRAVPGLPPGVVLLKGYLTMDEQIQIVRQIRELGIGPGGFYTPSYSTGSRLSLKMMCMGLHWEPRTSKYETTRSSYDGAKPPAIPPWLVDLSRRCLDAANTTVGSSSAGAVASSSASSSSAGGHGSGGAFTRFPPLQPDICLANFYERSGRLGMHQDKDEMADSLRAGLPVVSLSIGDAADFLYGSSREAEQAKSVRLESGDVLVFGGPGRMIFHSVSRVHPHTAPRELLAACGLRPGRLNLTFRQYRAKQ